jgi:LemA protein
MFAAFGLSGCSYNDLTAKQQNVKAKWANVESAMQRRADLIPNIVEAAKMAGVQEQEVFGQIADARAKLAGAQGSPPQGASGDRSPEQKQEINTLGNALGRLLVLTESYPQLRSNESFLKVQDELAGTENRIKVSRDDYNAAAQDFNTTRNQFPAVLTAGLFGFKEEPFFKADEGARTAPSVGDANSLRKTNAPAAPAPAAPANKAPAAPAANATK